MIQIKKEVMSNRKLSIKELSLLRKRAVYAVVKSGESKSHAAKLFGFSRTSITKYVNEYELYGEDSFHYKKRGVPPGSYQYLTDSQIKELIKILLNQTPDELSLPYTLWNSKAITALIETKFGTRYSGRGMRGLMNLPEASPGVSEETQLARPLIFPLIFNIAFNYLPIPAFTNGRNIVPI